MTRQRISVNGIAIFILLSVVAVLLFFSVATVNGATLPIVASPYLTVDVVGWQDGGADLPFVLTPCLAGGLPTHVVPANGAVFVQNAASELGCGQTLALVNLPDAAHWLARYTIKNDGGGIVSSFSVPPIDSFSKAATATLNPVVNTPGVNAYITTIPTNAATISAVYPDGAIETWDIAKPWTTHRLQREYTGAIVLEIGGPAVGPFPDATVACFATMDDGVTAGALVTPCKATP